MTDTTTGELWRNFSLDWVARLEANSAAHWSLQQCLVCGQRAHIRESAQPEYVYCETGCQEAPWSVVATLPPDMRSLGLRVFLCEWNAAIFGQEARQALLQTAARAGSQPAPPVTFNLSARLASLAQKRHILYTDDRMQLAVQRLEPGETVPLEIHESQDQFLRVEAGRATIRLGRTGADAIALDSAGVDVAIVPARTWHTIENASTSETLRFYTVYAPPAHTRQEQAEDDHVAEAK